MPHGYWRRNLNSLKRWLRSKRHKRFSASVDFVRSWRAKSRAAAVRARCLPYCGARPLTLTLSPDGGEGISCASSLLLMANDCSDSGFRVQEFFHLRLHPFIHLDQRRPGALKSSPDSIFVAFISEGIAPSP